MATDGSPGNDDERQPMRAAGGMARVHDMIVSTLGRQIVSGHFAPETALGSEIELGQLYSASRTAMREALKILSSKGLIDSRPKVGTVVGARSNWNMMDPMVLGWALEDTQQSAKVMEDLYILRRAIEPVAARLAAVNHEEEDYHAIRRALRAMATYVDHRDKAEQDLAFHIAILRATGNDLFLSLGELISVGLRHIFRAGFDATPDEDDRWITRHRRVADAIHARDPDSAEAEMHILLSEAREVRE